VREAILLEPFTFLVEAVGPPGAEARIALRTVEGEYCTREEFYDAQDHALKALERKHYRARGGEKIWSSIVLMSHDARRLADALEEVLEALEVG